MTTPRAFLPLTIVADDLTGAADTGALFAGAGAVPVTVWPASAPSARVRAIDTESRSLEAGEAARRVRAATGRLKGTMFKKIDSTLRGRVGPEIDALMRAGGQTSALVCPALPAERRVVVDRVLTVGAVPVAETPMAADPDFPAASGSSSVVDLLRPQLDRPLAWISLDKVRGARTALSEQLGRLSGTVVVADAETDEDLDALADAALAQPRAPLMVGAAGLAHSLARRLDLLAPHVEVPAGERWLIVAGSLHPATRRQIELAREAGLTVLATPDTPVDRAAAVAELVALARERLEAERYDVVLVTGGETAVALYRALGAERLDLDGAPRPGLAIGRLRLPGRAALPLVTKAGGFGPPELFVSLAREAVA
jgi:uncharacterized protein YgbK (DUF1537 family)